MVELNKNADINGTHRVGTLKYFTVETLIDALGEPHHTDIDGKVNYEWIFDTPYGTATLYDYWWNEKDEWSIGGKDERIEGLVQEFVIQKLSEAKLKK